MSNNIFKNRKRSQEVVYRDVPIKLEAFLGMIDIDVEDKIDTAQRRLNLIHIGRYYEKHRAFYKVKPPNGSKGKATFSVTFPKNVPLKSGPPHTSPTEALCGNLSINLQQFDIMKDDPELPDQEETFTLPDHQIKQTGSLVDARGNPLRRIY